MTSNAAAVASSDVVNRAVVQAIYDGAAQGNIEALFDAMTEDFVAYEADSLPWGGIHRGIEENRRLVDLLAHYLDLTTLHMHHVLVDRELVIGYGSVVWRGEHGDESVEVPLSECWEVRGGKVASIRPFFFDTASFAPSVRRP